MGAAGLGDDFDQAREIKHYASTPLSSDLDRLGTEDQPWNRMCQMEWTFGPGLQRLVQKKVKGLLFTQVLSLGSYERRLTQRGGFELADELVEKEERSAFGNGVRVKRWTAASPTVPVVVREYSVADHLGSDSATYNDEGQEQAQRGHLKEGETQKTERQSYDAWGARRDAQTWAPAPGHLGGEEEANTQAERPGSNLPRGYTGHEMLDDVGLIHMNGRLYDPALGRMCAADPYVQTPENLQNYNRYSYVLNNPLSQVDPSGHFIVEAIVGIVAAVVAVVGAVISAVIAFVSYLAALAAQFVVMVLNAVGTTLGLGPIGTTLQGAIQGALTAVSAFAKAHPIIAGALVGATYNGAQTAINGGSFSDVLKSAAIGAATGAVGAVVGAGLAGIPGAVSNAVGGGAAGAIAGAVVHSAAHGVAGGLMSMAMGGTFKDGFIGSAIGAGVSHITGVLPFMDDLQGPGAAKVIARTAVAAISGGAASALAGGKFADGAFSAAFFHVFNCETSRGKQKTIGESDYDNWPLENAEDLKWHATQMDNNKGKYFNLVYFDSSSTFSGQPGITGQKGYMAMYGPTGEEVGCWTIVSGGQATDYRLKKLGGSGSTRIASGAYISGMPSHGEFYPSGMDYKYSNSSNDPGFYNHGYSFKFGVGVSGNSSILFHPSAGVTQGCIGLTSYPNELFRFNGHMLNAISKQRTIKTIVK